MGNIIPLCDDPHLETQRLLPWYVVGKLDDDERKKIDAHLAACDECRTELQLERRLASEVANLSLNTEIGWTDLSRRLSSRPAKRHAARDMAMSVVQSLGRPRRFGWFLAGQTAVVLLVAALLVPFNESAPYRTLGSAPAETAGNVIVIFQPDATVSDLRQVLEDSGARLVDGPTTAGAYVIHVPDDKRSLVVDSLRTNKDVVLAEPIDMDTRR